MIWFHVGRFVEDSRLEDWKTLRKISSALAGILQAVSGCRAGDIFSVERFGREDCFIACASLADGLRLRDLPVNRGACDPISWARGNVLDFGERFYINPGCALCGVKEKKMSSEKGVASIS